MALQVKTRLVSVTELADVINNREENESLCFAEDILNDTCTEEFEYTYMYVGWYQLKKTEMQGVGEILICNYCGNDEMEYLHVYQAGGTRTVKAISDFFNASDIPVDKVWLQTEEREV